MLVQRKLDALFIRGIVAQGPVAFRGAVLVVGSGFQWKSALGDVPSAIEVGRLAVSGSFSRFQKGRDVLGSPLE